MLYCLLSLAAVLGSLIFTGYVGVLLGSRSRTLKLRIEAGPQIDARPRIQAGDLIH